RPQEALGAAELAKLLGREQAGLDEVAGAVQAIGIFADPEERVEIAQAALALLDVWLDDVAAVAHPLVALVALVELLLDVGRDRSGDDFLPEARHDLVEQGLVAPHVAGLESRGADRLVGGRSADHLVDAARGMADLEAEV